MSEVLEHSMLGRQNEPRADMTDWDAVAYDRLSALQRAMASEVLALLELAGAERVLDVGCGNGRVTTEIATRVPRGEVTGVDSSQSMIDFAVSNMSAEASPNLRFEVADARSLRFREEFDLVVSLNALHWIPDQDRALQSIFAALKSGGRAQLRLVPAGERRSLEEVIEETRLSSKWSGFFPGFSDPYLHLTAGQYASLAESSGFRVLRLNVSDKAWDFESRQSFQSFCSAMLTVWTRHLPEHETPAFITDVLDRYRFIAASQASEENTFKFYQMNATLAKP
jgi:trans-aconitate 2-methyltransferase